MLGLMGWWHSRQVKKEAERAAESMWIARMQNRAEEVVLPGFSPGHTLFYRAISECGRHCGRRMFWVSVFAPGRTKGHIGKHISDVVVCSNEDCNYHSDIDWAGF